MKFTFLLSCLLTLCAYNHLLAQDIPVTLENTASCDDLVQKIKGFDKDKTLLIFDIDNTLITTNDNKFGSDNWFDLIRHSAAKRSGYEKCHELLKSEYTKNTGQPFNLDEFRHSFINIVNPYVIYNMNPSLIKATCPDFSTTLNQYKNSMALTSRGVSLYVPTKKALEKANFNFIKNPIKSGIFSVIVGGDKNIYYQDGVIYTEGGHKGYALLEFLKWAQLNGITRIVYVEDAPDKIKSVSEVLEHAKGQAALKNMGIKDVVLMNADSLEKTKKSNFYNDNTNFEAASEIIKKSLFLLRQDREMINK